MFLRENWYRDLGLIVICVFLYQSAKSNQRTVNRLDTAVTAIRVEGAHRRDQTCLIFERGHKDDVSQLQATYNFIAKMTPKDAESNLNRTIILRLPDAERKAQTSTPPDYCRPASVGLKEPFPVIPSRPPGLLPVQ